MAHARDFIGVVFQDGPATLLARVLGADGSPIVPVDIASARYSIWEVNECDPASSTAVAGHQDAELSPSSILHAELQLDSIWTTDEVGYNFRHDLDVSQNAAFLTAGRLYQVRYELFPVEGQKLVFRFLLRAI